MKTFAPKSTNFLVKKKKTLDEVLFEIYFFAVYLCVYLYTIFYSLDW